MKKIVMMACAMSFAMNMMAENVKFKVSNMHCDNCANRVEKVLKGNEAVSQVKVNLECKAVCVSYDEKKTNAETLMKALTDAKFQTEIMKKCNKEGGCKHDGEDKCENKDNQEKHECGGEGCGHHDNKTNK